MSIINKMCKKLEIDWNGKCDQLSLFLLLEEVAKKILKE